MSIIRRFNFRLDPTKKLIREELASKSTPKVNQQLSLAAAEVMRPHYEPGTELATFTDSNTEDFYEYEDYT